MSADSDDARLIHAKKLLNKFQSRQQQQDGHQQPITQDDDVVLIPAPASQMSDPQLPEQTNQSGRQSLRSSRSSSFVKIDHASSNEVENLRVALNEKENQLGAVVAKLQALHGHYVELHKAYSETQRSTEQISQLQTALAIAVDEKTQLQTELRNSNAHSKSLEAELELRARGTVGDHQMIQLQTENQKLIEKIASQAAVIAQQRKECAELEAKIVIVNQDKNDVQARLKYVYHEKDQLNGRLQEMRNELNIKDIFIRQISKQTTTVDSENGQQTIEKLTEEKTFFEVELKKRTDELTNMRNEFQATKQHYESCLLQARNHSATLEQTLEQVNQQKRELEFAKRCADEELDILRKTAAQSNPTTSTDDSVALDHAADSENLLFEYQAMKNSLERAESEFQRQSSYCAQLNSILEDKENAIVNLQQSLSESNEQVQRLNEQIRQLRSMDADAQQLANQLQNERATVSRAVGQNLELKEQLRELQDQLVMMTNRCAEIEVKQTSQRRSESVSQELQFHNVSNIQYPSTEEAYSEQQNKDSHLENSVQFSEQIEGTQVASQEDSRVDSSLSSTDGEVDSSAATTPADELHHQVALSIESQINEFLSSPRPTSELQRGLQTAFYELHENESELRSKLEQMEQLNRELQHANRRLEYMLTAVESENESIADFIELYRQQRAQIRAKVEEKEVECERLRAEKNRLKERVEKIQTAILGSLTNAPVQEVKEDGGICKAHELIQLLKEMETVDDQQINQLANSLRSSSMNYNPDLHCRECKGQLHDL
ncbi:hypothetical protein M3Y98_00760700 [Aphelenchoides besseyi]|nr:hypothetical protein M3Y98_00760700 [Aphelenchoides besseyi]KAI6211641.1 hypothetical protein M3Y96_00455800 [Aphelenchoides besseyi]